MSSDNVQASVNMNQQVKIHHIEVTDKNNTTSSIGQDAVLSGDINKSIYSYVDKCYCQINNKIYNAFPNLVIGSEVKIFVSTTKKSPPQELFYGVVRKRQKKWHKGEDWDITEFWATSFAADVSLKMLYSWEMQYTNGIGEVFRQLAELNSLKADCILDKNCKGSVYFDHISALDAMRHLAYLRGWCLSFKGKIVKLAPCERPQHSGVTINLEDLPTGTITEG